MRAHINSLPKSGGGLLRSSTPGIYKGPHMKGFDDGKLKIGGSIM